MNARALQSPVTLLLVAFCSLVFGFLAGRFSPAKAKMSGITAGTPIAISRPTGAVLTDADGNQAGPKQVRVKLVVARVHNEGYKATLGDTVWRITIADNVYFAVPAE